ncbi:hypothetical protein FYM69_06205 [Lactobacillus salivarius]|nr:hypothetical protein [Ligilactobacillus salivarius]
MDIRSLLMKDIMIMDLKATTKSEVIDEMVHNYYKHGIIDDEDLYKKDIIENWYSCSSRWFLGITSSNKHLGLLLSCNRWFYRSSFDYEFLEKTS